MYKCIIIYTVYYLYDFINLLKQQLWLDVCIHSSWTFCKCHDNIGLKKEHFKEITKIPVFAVVFMSMMTPDKHLTSAVCLGKW